LYNQGRQDLRGGEIGERIEKMEGGVTTTKVDRNRERERLAKGEIEGSGGSYRQWRQEGRKGVGKQRGPEGGEGGKVELIDMVDRKREGDSETETRARGNRRREGTQGEKQTREH
jgi:hypothetical protein